MKVRKVPISALWSNSLQDEVWLAKTRTFVLPEPEKDAAAFFAELYKKYYTRVLAYIRFRLGRLDYAEDLTSLVFERAFMHIQDLQTTEAAGSWLFRIAQNCVVDYFRRHRQEVSLETLLYTEHPWQESPEDIVLMREEVDGLLLHLKNLSEREQEVIGLKFVAQLSNNEIARILHMPSGTVGSHLYRALKRLREAVSAERRSQ